MDGHECEPVLETKKREAEAGLQMLTGEAKLSGEGPRAFFDGPAVDIEILFGTKIPTEIALHSIDLHLAVSVAILSEKEVGAPEGLLKGVGIGVVEKEASGVCNPCGEVGNGIF